MSQNIKPIDAIHRIAQLLNLTEQKNNLKSSLLKDHYRLRSCTSEKLYQCIEFGSGNISQIKHVFEELGFVIAQNKNIEKFFFTVELDTFKPPYWFDRIVNINLRGVTPEMVKQIISGSETRVKSWQNFSKEKAGLGTELARVYFQDELDEDTLELVLLELKEKLPLVQIERSRAGRALNVPNKYVFKKPPSVNRADEGLKIQEDSKSDEEEVSKQNISAIPTNPTEESHREPKDFVQELLDLMERYGQIPKPEKLDTAGMIKIPASEKVITLPMSALKKMDIEKGEIKINVQVLRDFLIENFSVES